MLKLGGDLASRVFELRGTSLGFPEFSGFRV